MTEVGTTQTIETYDGPWLILDTETSGLANYKLPADHPDQPRLAALTMILCGADLLAQNTITHLIKPDGWVLEPGAAAINGLTMERLEAEGVPVIDVLETYVKLLDQGYAVGAYGAQFDCKVMRGELRRAGIPDRFEITKNFCAMRKSMGIVKKQSGKGGWPKLSDACIHFNITQTGHHTSTGDAISCLEVMRWLKKIGRPIIPEVHKAADDNPANPKNVKATADLF